MNEFRAILDDPEKHFGHGLTPVHREALRYVLDGGPRWRQGRPDLAEELVPAGFAGFPAPMCGEMAGRLLEVLLLGGCHDNLVAWLAPIGDREVVAWLERQSDMLELPRAELAAIVIGTLPSTGEVAEGWLWEQKDSVLEAAMRRIRSDSGLRCFVRFALGSDGARFTALAGRVLRRPRAFEGRVAVALLAVSDGFVEAVAASWRPLAPAAKLHWGLQFEAVLGGGSPFAAENDETIRGAMEDVRFFDTAQAGWVAAVAVKRFGGRYREAIRRGMRECSRPEVVVRGLGRLGLECRDESALRVAVEIVEPLRGEAGLAEAVAEALECLLRGTI
jgi:hypothetical protein